VEKLGLGISQFKFIGFNKKLYLYVSKSAALSVIIVQHYMWVAILSLKFIINLYIQTTKQNEKDPKLVTFTHLHGDFSKHFCPRRDNSTNSN
jgi:hypothetical protein